MHITLQTVTPAQLPALMHLELPPEQEPFAGDMAAWAQALTQRHAEGSGHGVAIVDGATVVGAFMLCRPPASPPWLNEGNALTLHAFRVDPAQQGRGHALAALAALPAYVRRHWPDTRALMLGVNARNVAAQRLYFKAGWQDTGRRHPGPIGEQLLLRLPLPA